MIETIGALAYAQNQTARVLPTTGTVVELKPDEETPAVEISISPAAQKAHKFLKSLPELVLDPAVHMRNAAARLKQVMSDLGIPSNTEVKITSNNDGTFKVEADHVKAKELESMLNDGSERELRNALIGAHAGSVIQRIGKAVEIAMRAADANPDKTDEYYSWVRTVANQAKGLKFDFSYSEGEISGNFLKADGTAMAVTEGLKLLA